MKMMSDKIQDKKQKTSTANSDESFQGNSLLLITVNVTVLPLIFAILSTNTR